MKTRPYRLIMLLIVSTIAIIGLTTVLTSTADSLYPSKEMQVGNGNSIFLPIILQGGVGATSGPSDASQAEDAWWARRGEYLVLWQKPDGAPADTQQNPGQNLWLNYDILDLSQLLDAGFEDRADAILESYRNDPAVALVEPNYIYTTTLIPGDPRQNDQYAWDLIDGYEAWDITMGDSSTIIAVIDTGVDLDHPDLVNKIVPGFDFIDNDTLANDEAHGHGTHVAGSAAASTDNAQDGAGTCPNCSIMPVRALGNNGRGSLTNIAAAVTFAANNGAQVINLSLGASARSEILELAINQASANGVFAVCAAGNSNTSNPSFPAGFDNCFSVASVTETDQRSDFSNFGASVDIAAPGSAILSTALGGGMTTLQGTSMASPHVAGLAGLLISMGMNGNDIRAHLCNTADDIAGTGEFWQCGRSNMLNAVQNVPQEPTPTFTPTSSPTPTAQPSPTATPTPLPTTNPAERDPLDDGSFEDNYYSQWSYSNSYIRSSERANSGQYSARLGGENNSSDLVEQQVTIPANGRLSYSWFAESVDSPDLADNLVLEVELADNSDATLILRHLPRQQGWRRSEVDVSEFANESVIIRLRAETNGDVPTTFFVDDVVLASTIALLR